MRAISLRARLLIGMGFVATILVGVSAVITTSTRAQLIDQADERLQVFAHPSRGDQGDFRGLPSPPDDSNGAPPDAPQRLSDIYQGWIDSNGNLTGLIPNTGGDGTAPELDGVELPKEGSKILTVKSEGGDTTYRVLAVASENGIDITGLPIDGVNATIRRLLLVEISGALGILAALGLVSWWVMRLGIRPLKEMTATATRIAGGDLSVRVPEGAAGTEPGDLAAALNRMLGRIETAIDERAASEDRLRRFVADASHELRTPVTTIRGYAELYRQGGLAQPESLDDAMRRTEQEAARMGRLVEDMLTLAKLDQHRPLEARPLDISALARDAALDARATAPSRTISLEVPDGDVTITGDEDRLRQVVANLVGNARVHTDPLDPITIRVTSNDQSVVLEIEDEGPGMPTEVAERATERFYRADPARSRHRGGSGLGLSIVDATVAAHGGTVEIDSALDRGTCVRLTLPRATRGS